MASFDPNVRREYRVKPVVNTDALSRALTLAVTEGWQVLNVLHDGQRFVVIMFRMVRV